jgi:hypothetical protein
VKKVRADTSKKLAELDATEAACYAQDAEDAQYAIGHALDAIEEAERSVTYAMRTEVFRPDAACAGAAQ